MSDKSLHALARAVGLARTWRNYRGERRVVADRALSHILTAMGWPADSKGALSASLAKARSAGRERPALITAEVGRTVVFKGAGGHAQLRFEQGGTSDLTLSDEGGGSVSLRAPDTPGYHQLELDGGVTILAVAPRRALTTRDLTGGGKAWGLAVQLYSLNEGGDFGDFGDLARLCGRLAAHGADAVAVSPTHALFTADIARYAPYGPSTRLFLNPLYAETPRDGKGASDDLIDWTAGGEAKLAALRQAYDAFVASGDGRPEFEAFVRQGGESLLNHARFEALDGRFRPLGFSSWRDWPDGYNDVRSAAVQSLGAADPEVEFHLFLQWRADAAAAGAQAAAKSAGMAIGLISDLAVGMDAAGSHAWSRPEDILRGISIGAPPDMLARHGQSWGLTTFSPTALRECGYAPFLATVRAALRHAGGVRIDHAIGLEHLWISPDGAKASEGAYLQYPFDDLLRLLALESHRHEAIVIGEDLGTVPPHFGARSTAAGMAGMRVLWFEQTKTGAFRNPRRWGRQAAAMTTTHDLPTVAGWWRGRDIALRAEIEGGPEPEAARSERAAEAENLWRAMLKSGAASGAQPATEQTRPVVDAAVAHVGGSDCDLALIAIEDILGQLEQPNLPGTTDQHPNWRRRLPPGNGLDAPEAIGRLKRLGQIRERMD